MTEFVSEIRMDLWHTDTMIRLISVATGKLQVSDLLDYEKRQAEVWLEELSKLDCYKPDSSKD